MRYGLLVLSMLLLGGTLDAQVVATLNITGTFDADERSYHLIAADFGAAPIAATFTLSVSGNSATAGLDDFIMDRDAVAILNSPTGQDSGSDPGTGMINLTVTTPAYTGIKHFVLGFSGDMNGAAGYAGVLESADLPPGALTQLLAEAHPEPASDLDIILGVAASANITAVSAAPLVQEFQVDFGAVAQDVTFLFRGEGDDTGQMTVYEILGDGSPQALHAPAGGSGSWGSTFILLQSSLRSGLVRFRVESTANAVMDGNWSAIFPSSATLRNLAVIQTTGTLAASQTRYHLFRIDFGPSPTELSISFLGAETTGSFDLAMIDVDELVTNGIATAVVSALPFTTAVYSGVHDFIIVWDEDSGFGNLSYDMRLGVAVPQSAITAVATNTGPIGGVLRNLFGRAVNEEEIPFTAAGTVEREFNVDFGGAPQLASFWFQAESSVSAGTAALYYVDGTGNPQLIVSMNMPAGTGPIDVNIQTPSLSGLVRFRVVITTTGASDVDFVAAFEYNVTVTLVPTGGGGGGDGGGDDGGCTAGQAGGLGALLPLLLAARRRRKA